MYSVFMSVTNTGIQYSVIILYCQNILSSNLPIFLRSSNFYPVQDEPFVINDVIFEATPSETTLEVKGFALLVLKHLCKDSYDLRNTRLDSNPCFSPNKSEIGRKCMANSTINGI